MTALLEVAGVSVVYHRAITAVREVSLEVAAGTGVAVLGANGAGKSTLMNALAGWLPVARGAVRFDGEDITRLDAAERARRGLAFVPEGGHIFRRLSVRENLLMGAYLAPRPEDRIEAACAPFPILSERLDQLAGTLSGGERQMLAIARAMMARPRLLLIDELSVGMMPQAVDHVMAAVGALVADGVAVLLTEQNARKAMRVVEHVHLMENGRIVLSGTPQTMADNPHVVAVYLGA